MSNRIGIPNVTSTSVEETSTAVVYHFDRSYDIPFAGVVLARLVQGASTASANKPIYFGKVPLTYLGGGNVLAKNLSGLGIYQVYYNSETNLLQLMTGYVASASTESETKFK